MSEPHPYCIAHDQPLDWCSHPEPLEPDIIIVDMTDPLLGSALGKLPLNVHSPQDCAGRQCCIHNPSDHPLRDAPLNWRADRRLMERTCPHGIGHPDPDDLWYKQNVLGWSEEDVAAEGVHGCDGCCHGRR